MAGGATMSYEEACEQAYKLRKQGMTYPAIAEHFKSIGYKSTKSKGFIGHLTARHMADLHEKREKQELSDERLEEAKSPTYVVSPVGDTLRAVAKILEWGEVTDAIKIKMARRLIEDSRSESSSSGAPTKNKGGRPKKTVGGSSGRSAQ